VCGRSSTVADLRELGGSLLAFYGQHEHRKLMLQGTQLDVLDAFCGDPVLRLRERVRAVYGRARELEAEAERLGQLAGARERELDLLRFELGEIEAARPSEAEEHELVRDRDRLRNVESLRGAAATSAAALVPEDGGGVAELLAMAAGELEGAATADPALAELAERLAGLRYEAEDAGGELRRYLESLDVDGPGRLQDVEERLALFARLERKHGGSITDVLAHADRCRARCEELEEAEVALEVVAAELATTRSDLARLAEELTGLRSAAAPALATAVRERLAELAMAEAEFEVALSPLEGGCGPLGTDTVELLIAPNAGVPAAALRDIASGGELSRVMLALLSVAHTGPGAGL
jgi:DNA repair protein RecN (Recombination protein N)